MGITSKLKREKRNHQGLRGGGEEERRRGHGRGHHAQNLPCQSQLTRMTAMISQICKEATRNGNGMTIEDLLSQLHKEADLRGTRTKVISSRDKDKVNSTMKRRVYDVLNILEAINIITKTQQQNDGDQRRSKNTLIKWNGLPTDLFEHSREEALHAKRMTLQRAIHQQICFSNLSKRNASAATTTKSFEENTQNSQEDNLPKAYLPFVVVKTEAEAVIDCEAKNDGSFLKVYFDKPYELEHDLEILKKMNMYVLVLF